MDIGTNILSQINWKKDLGKQILKVFSCKWVLAFKCEYVSFSINNQRIFVAMNGPMDQLSKNNQKGK